MKATERTPMTVWKYGRMGTSWDKDGKPCRCMVPVARTTSMWYGSVYEDEYYLTEAEAVAALAALQADHAEREKEARQVLSRNQPLADRMEACSCTQEDCNLPEYEELSKAHRSLELAQFVRSFGVVAVVHSECVTRLNTLPTDSGKYGEAMRREIEQVVKHYGRCFVEWSCTGHTRAAWQSAAVADWVRQAHPEWKATADGVRCSIKA